MKYVIEVAKTGSITQAALSLDMSQPNLSKAIHAVEYELGFTIFNRSSKGVLLTKDGEAFVASAKEVLEKFEELEAMHKQDTRKHRSFGVSVCRASYISYAFTRFINEVSSAENLSVDFCETNSLQVIRNISSRKHNIGVIRFSAEHEKYFQKLLRDTNTVWETLMTSRAVILMSDKNPLAQKETLCPSDLSEMIELINGDDAIPAHLLSEIKKHQVSEAGNKTVSVYAQGSIYDILVSSSGTYIWSSPVPKEIRARFGLVQRQLSDSPDYVFKDAVIQNKDYALTSTEALFLRHLYAVRDEIEPDEL